MEDLYRGIDLGAVTTSMTINGPAAVIFAMYVANAEASGVERARLGGTLQNDILKEYQAQKEFIFPPRPSLRLVADTIRFCTAEMPRWHPLSISGYHIREAGSTAAEELAFTLANGFAYVELGLAAGLDIDAFAPRLSFFFNAHIDFFEEIAKYRAARRIWARWLRDRYGAQSERSLQMRFHTQTAGVSLTAQQPEVNIVRTAIEALAGVLGGTQSLHTNSMDETFALPTERAARHRAAHAAGDRERDARRQRRRSARRLLVRRGAHRRARAAGGSDLRASTILVRGSMLDGAVRGVEEGWFQSAIADSAYELERKLNAGRHAIVGVTGFVEGNDEPRPRRCGSVPRLKRSSGAGSRRCATSVTSAVDRVLAQGARRRRRAHDQSHAGAARRGTRVRDARARSSRPLAGVFGRWVEQPRI